MPTTTTIALSGQFHKTVIGGVDLSPYFDEIQLTYQRDMLDITVFALGGGPVTRSNIRGAMISDMSLNGPYDPVLAKAMEIYMASRTGVLVQIYGGSNALPAQGDELISGYFSIFSVGWPYRTFQKSTLKFDCKIPDGAAVPAVYYGTI